MNYNQKYRMKHKVWIFLLLIMPNIYAATDTETDLYITNAVSSINNDIIEQNSVIQIDQALNGTVPGLYSIRNGGQRFGQLNYNFYIRGKSTTADATPLILVDGVEGNISLLDPSEIECITVLKDVSELAMFGLRGANGVISVKTKRGKSSKNFMKVDIRAGFQSPISIADKLNAFEYTTLHNEANLNDGTNPVYQPNNYLNHTDVYRYPNTNLPQDFLKNTAFHSHYNFSAGGGNEIAQYFAFISYTRQDGIFDLPKTADGLKQTYNERYNFRTNLDVNLGKGFKLNTNISAVFDDRRSPWLNGSTNVNNTRNYIFNALINTPANAFPLTNPDGSLAGTAEYRDNPIGLLSSGIRIENTRKLTANVLLKKDFNKWIKGFSVFGQYAFENYNAYYKANYTQFAVYQLNDDDTYTPYGADDTKMSSSGGQMSDYYSDTNFKSGAEYNNKWGEHQLYATVFYNQYTSYVSGDNPPYVWLGTVSKILYGWMNRYFAQLSGSYQGSNSYAYGKRFGFFPAASVAWVISEENFLKQNESINFFKLRASAGLNANDRAGGSRFMYRQAFYTGNGYGFGDPNGTSQGSYEGVLNNPDLSWETSAKINGGFDLNILQSALTISMDYFYEKRSSILIDQTNITPSMIGISLPQYNAGIIQNQGIEGNLQYNRQIGMVDFFAGLNFMYAKNKIIDLKELTYPDNENYRYRKGNSIDAVFGLTSNKLYDNNFDLDNTDVVSSYGPLHAGDIQYVDKNGDGIINEADKSVIGTAFPEFIYGLNLGVKVKKWDLFLYAEGSELFDIHLKPGQYSKYAYEHRWTGDVPNPNAQYPRLSHSSTHNAQTSTFWIEKGHIMKLSAIECGYTIPNQILQKSGISNLRIYAKLYDFFSTFEKREQRDQEFPNAGYTVYPAMKTALLGISLNL